MSHITLGQQGLAAVESRQWNTAVAKLSTALQTSTNPRWLIGRSRALAGLRRYQEALEDAELAWHRAYERNQRAEMAEAQYRRGVACRGLGRFADADACCIYAMRLIKGFAAVEKEDPAEALVGKDGLYAETVQGAQALSMGLARVEAMDMSESLEEVAKRSREGDNGQTMLWRMACTLRVLALTDMEKGGDEGKVLGVRTRPELRSLAVLEGFTGAGEGEGEGGGGAAAGAGAAGEAGEAAGAAQGAGAAAGGGAAGAAGSASGAASEAAGKRGGPLRFQEFQSNTVFWVSIFTKGVDRGKLKVEFLPGEVRMDPVVYPGGEVGELRLELDGQIVAEGSIYTVTPNKVELSLKKETAGKTLYLKGAKTAKGAEVELAADNGIRGDGAPANPMKAPVYPTQASMCPMQAPYPTSAKSGPKNWDKIGDEEGDEEEKDVNHFFKMLYKGATPEQQRAMMKSFTESNGTALSTDWNDVKDRTVETVPPDGVEAKKWE